jgi:hypothetical protein
VNDSQRETLERLLDPDGPAALPEAARHAVAAVVHERSMLLTLCSAAQYDLGEIFRRLADAVQLVEGESD